MRLGIDASNIRVGGGVTHLIELLRAARPQEYGISRVVVWGSRSTFQQMPTKPWLESIHEPMLDGPLPVRLYWQKVKLAQLAKQACDFLFVPGGGYGGDFRPFVTMSRNMLPFERNEMSRYGASWMFFRLFLLRFGQNNSFRNADGLIFLTKYAQTRVLKQIASFNGHSTIIPHGVDDCFRLFPRAQRPISSYSEDKPFKLLYTSIIDVYKHQWQVAKAVASLRQKGFPIVLELIGSAYPPAMRRLQEVIRCVDPERKFIHYRGEIPYSELASHYHQADSFVFASSCENRPNILIEAMASGLPIACSNRGPMPEILGDAGVYFDPEQSEEIARALSSLIEDSNLREHYAWLAYERAQLYSWERCARETFSFLAEVARRR